MLFDMHVHTSEVSPCAIMPAREVVNRYKEKGFDGIVITDHIARYYMECCHKASYEDYCKIHYETYLAAKDEGEKVGLTVLYGCELKLDSSNNDYLMYGITPEFLIEFGDIMKFSLSELKQACDKNSVLHYQAHPFRDGAMSVSPSLLFGMEAVNGCHIHEYSFRNDIAMLWTDKYNLHKIAGSDCHSADAVGLAGLDFLCEIKSNSDLLDALKEDNYYIVQKTSKTV